MKTSNDASMFLPNIDILVPKNDSIPYLRPREFELHNYKYNYITILHNYNA